MKPILALLAFVMGIALIVVVPPLAAPIADAYGGFSIFDCARAVVLCAVVATVAAFVITRNKKHGSYLVNLFLLALIARVVIGTVIFVMKGQNFFAVDAWGYDDAGYQHMLAWSGDGYADALLIFSGNSMRSGWGMDYIVGAIYSLVGRNMLATQYFNCVLGAATAPIIFLCAEEVFKNRRVARMAGIAVAFFPSLVLWSSQGIKDGPTVFVLALSIFATLKLGQKFTYTYLVTLVTALFCVIALRFYVFYMMIVAVAGALVIGMRAITAQSFIRQFAVVVIVGLALTYLGVTRQASAQFDEFGSLERLQRSRLDMATSAQSGFGQDVDISTTSGALSAIPIGLIYLLFAPFPWQFGSLRSSITAPEMFVWWLCFPVLVTGLWFSIKHRLRQLSPILIFTTLLTLAYSVVQGNVGTAYRQRAQVMIFYFIFIAVGVVLIKEKREQRKLRSQQAKRLLMKRPHRDVALPQQVPQKL